LPEVHARLEPLFTSIGRIELPTNPSIPYGGTGFVVGPNLLMTNRHVARLFTEGLGMHLTYHGGALVQRLLGALLFTNLGAPKVRRTEQKCAERSLD
jgi:hypothetical protein